MDEQFLHARNLRPVQSRIDATTVLPGLEILLALYVSARQQKMLVIPLVEEETPFVLPSKR